MYKVDCNCVPGGCRIANIAQTAQQRWNLAKIITLAVRCREHYPLSFSRYLSHSIPPHYLVSSAHTRRPNICTHNHSFVDMSTYPHDPQNFNPYPSQRHAQEDYKDSYDDLIDEYASPYAATPRHKTYAVEAPPLAPADHRRGVSQKSFSGKLSNETLNDGLPAYPPLSSIKEIDTRSFLQKVCFCTSH